MDTPQLTTTTGIVPTTEGNFELSATCPQEMVQCHQAAIEWCKRKIELVKNEAKELCEAAAHAKKSKWHWKTLDNHHKLAVGRVTFYQKILAAFEAGYYIVPNFPVTLFAIRTDKAEPPKQFALCRYVSENNREQDAQILPQGEGEYQNPNPVIVSGPEQTVRKDNQDAKRIPVWNDGWNALEFPANMARLHVMEAANRAMALKVFDEVGFLPEDRKRNPDPLLIGRIIDPKPVPYGTKKVVSFIIAWHIDTKSL